MRYLEKVVTLRLDETLCNGCGMCLQVCPHGVFKLVEKRAVLQDRGACMECGACAKNCQKSAIQVRAGMGCAAGVLAGILSKTDPTCGSAGSRSSCC